MCAAGVRGGKTLSSTIELLWSIYRDLAAGKGRKPAGIGRRRQPRLLYWVVAPTSALNIHVHRYITSICPPELIDRVYEDAIWLKPDILIEFKTAERPDLLVGASVNGILVDEACRVKSEAWDGALRGRVADTGGFVILVSSPTGGRNSWVYQRFVSRSGSDDVEAFSWRTVDNTAVPELISDAAQARAIMPEAWYRREYEASWDSFGGSIYEEFNESLHVTNEEKLRFELGLGRDRPLTSVFTRVIGALDFGFTAAGCLLVVGELGDGNWIVLDESYGPGRRPIAGSSVTWLGECQRFAQLYGVRDFVGDPEDAGAMFDLRNNGVRIRSANKQVYTGIRRVASALHPRPNGKPGLRFFDRCKNAIREIRNYQWKEAKGGGSFLEEPADGQEDHAMDALRYSAMELKFVDFVERQRANQPVSRPIGQ